MDRKKLIDALHRDEGDRPDIYDDATGQPIRPGCLVKGTPTCGSGITGPFTAEERWYLLNSRIDQTLHGLDSQLPWFLALDDVRQRALCNMAFNLGVSGLLSWHRTLGFMARRDYESAAKEIENSHPWIDQVGQRGHRIAEMIRTGVDTPIKPSSEGAARSPEERG